VTTTRARPALEDQCPEGGHFIQAMLGDYRFELFHRQVGDDAVPGRIATATEPTPPTAPVTRTSPLSGVRPAFSSAMAWRLETASGGLTSQSP
jgi:hypothetical protein